MKRSQRGFTLMELMVVIVIVAILAAVAVPLYINYVKDAKRTEAKGAIAAIVSAEQIYYQRYSQTYTADTTDIKLSEIVDEAARNWEFTIQDASDNGFTVWAHGKDAVTDVKGLDVTCIYDRTAGPQWTDAPPE